MNTTTVKPKKKSQNRFQKKAKFAGFVGSDHTQTTESSYPSNYKGEVLSDWDHAS